MKESRQTARTEASAGEPAAAALATPSLGAVDRACLALLLMVTVLAWCLATGKGWSARWNMPTTYIDPTYSDFVGICGYMHSLRGWSALPFGGKVAPDLGAPDVVVWSATVTTDEAVNTIFKSLMDVFGLFSGFNLGVLLAHVAAAVTFYLVARKWLEAMPAWSFVGALAFGLAPYLFAQSPHHINCLYAWHLPLFPMVWTWAATKPGLEWRSRRFWQAIAIGVVTGLQNPYYTLILCQLTLLGGAVVAWRQRSRAALMSAVAVVLAAAAAFLVSNLDTIGHRITHGAGDKPLVAHREYRWMDIYGFKVVDLFIPSFTHHSHTLAQFGLAHRQASALNDEEGCAYLGLLGIGCLLCLLAATGRALLDGSRAAVPMQAWWLLWVVIYFSTGGLNSLVAAFTGFTLFRTATRFSVVVLVIALLWAVQRLSAWQRAAAGRHAADVLRIGTLTAAVAACLLVVWDQVPRGPTAEQTAQIETLVKSDREFVGSLEAKLPNRAMVFQLPVMDGTPLPGVPASDHFRPTLASTHLHWSHGALPGSTTLQWQQAVQQKLLEGATIDQQSQRIRFDVGNVRQAVDQLRGKGFAAIYLNRNGFPDRGKGLFDALLDIGYDAPPIYSPAGDLACIPFGNGPAR